MTAKSRENGSVHLLDALHEGHMSVKWYDRVAQVGKCSTHKYNLVKCADFSVVKHLRFKKLSGKSAFENGVLVPD